jgi:hypothetical protein
MGEVYREQRKKLAEVQEAYWEESESVSEMQQVMFEEPDRRREMQNESSEETESCTYILDVSPRSLEVPSAFLLGLSTLSIPGNVPGFFQFLSSLSPLLLRFIFNLSLKKEQ